MRATLLVQGDDDVFCGILWLYQLDKHSVSATDRCTDQGPKALNTSCFATTECFQSPVPSHPRTAIPQGTVLQAAVIQLTRPTHTHTRSDFKAWNAPINVIPVAASSHTQISCILYLNMLEKKWKEDVYLLITCKAHDSSLDASLPHCVYTHKHIHRCTCTPRDYDIIFSYIFFVLCLVWITKCKLRKCNWNIP